ncbi:AraC family transcriptional regulator [Bowmanella yangjiangensis]|uniref:AraC family transcriptional regulator n=1 Tax=Bowmanella yangjiangensis TaxID=2811230 RepID=A0ABS3CYH9_9ALTE|nr:helix-turn-helix domain-containing protein [Bowmanella yangjiangensis]MBN7821594.1 AraC family transcriptional regulator [Bowmanella yangjiangensis]
MHNLAHMGFSLHSPCSLLAEHINCYWTIKAAHCDLLQRAEFMHPEGGSGIVFNFADPMQFNHNWLAGHCLVNGPTRKTTRLTLFGKVDALGVRFKPGKGMVLFAMPLAQVVDTQADISDILPNFPGQELAERMAPLDTPARIQLLEQQLLRLLSLDLGEQHCFENAVSRIQLACGQQPIQHIFQDMGIGQRQLERQFGRWLGMSPKQYSKLQRISLARDLLKNAQDNQSLTDLALQAGYYDQAHFIHEFKQVVGITPGQYLKRKQCDHLIEPPTSTNTTGIVGNSR